MKTSLDKLPKDFIKFRISSEDDLWTTAKLSKKGRRIGMLGERRDQTTTGEEGGRAKAATRKKTWIELIIEYNEFQTFSDTLRVHGIIHEAAFDKGSHHTHVVQIGDEIKLSINGEWPYEDIQLKNTMSNSVYIEMIKSSLNWGDKTNMMYVVGATKANHIEKIRSLIPNHFILVPGVGAQGGDLDLISKFQGSFELFQ